MSRAGMHLQNGSYPAPWRVRERPQNRCIRWGGQQAVMPHSSETSSSSPTRRRGWEDDALTRESPAILSEERAGLLRSAPAEIRGAGYFDEVANAISVYHDSANGSPKRSNSQRPDGQSVFLAASKRSSSSTRWRRSSIWGLPSCCRGVKRFRMNSTGACCARR